MGFRFRLASFFVAALVTVQLLTAVLVYQVSRRQLIDEGKRQLDVSAAAFGHQLDETSDRVAASVQVLALDFALRSAIAQRDEETLRSALRNHAQRVGADQLLVVDTGGRITGDSRGVRGDATFPYTDLLERGMAQPTSAVVSWHGKATWMVVVPVLAPDVIGLIAAAVPIDAALLARLEQQSVLPKSIELATPGADGWQVLVHGSDPVQLAAALGDGAGALPTTPRLVLVDGREYLVRGMWLARSDASPPVAAVFGYSVDDALQPYRSVGTAWAGLLLLGLAVGLAGAFLIARQVSRPVEALAASARRIEAGDYTPGTPLARGDELGALSVAIASMAQAIREREAHIRYQAGHDQVTGLNNRNAAEAAIQPVLQAGPEQPAALLMVGMRRLPELVKTMGHALADRVMADASARLRRLVPEAQIARPTDTEFSIFLPGTEQDAAIACGFRLVDALAEPYREADLTLDLEPAAGLALHPRHGRTAATLLSHATIALIGALDSEEAIAVYDPDKDPHRPERLSLMSDLREAIDLDHLALHYQPRLNLATGRIDGVEGLVRWTHKQRGPIPPDAFIMLAEETGNIRRLTRWALATGIQQARRWQDEGLDLRVAINVSARDLDDADLPRRVAELLALHALDPSRIMLEVTESSVMGKPGAAIDTLKRLADQGIDLAIDDFGVGQSSFAYLRQLPVRELKIDKMFISRIHETPVDRTIVRSIVDLGHALGYRVTAEGVDNEPALQFLREIGCDHAQGYHIARPLPVAQIHPLVAT
jgi:diguanylate cyclase (GGDEF)-like protein